MSIVMPSLLGLLGPRDTTPPPGARLEINNPNAFDVEIGTVGEIVQNVSSVGTGTVSSPGTNGGGNVDITFF